MEITINDRIEMLVNEYFNGNKAAFEKAVGLASSLLSSYIGKQRRSRPNVDMITKIVTKLDVDARWLLTGEGCMHERNSNIATATDNSAAAVNGNAVTINNTQEIDRKLVEKLISENELLNKLLEEKERFINHLLNNNSPK